MRVMLLLAIMALCVFSVGCRKGAPIGDVSASTVTAASTPLTEQDVRKAILTACSFRGWQATEVSPGLIEARLMVRNKHTIVVDIPYTATTYSIKYKSSTNMEYDSKSDGSAVIHPNYNKWVGTLNSDINTQIIRAGK